MPRNAKDTLIRTYYRAVFRAWGRQHWWPARTRFEVIVGAYLTQNTAWRNVEMALANLRVARLLTVAGIRGAALSDLKRLIRPAGYFRQKAQRLKIFVSFLDRRYQGSLTKMFAQPTAALRDELLGLNGIGPETADSILLYAGNHPVFVVDAYTRRILARHNILPEEAAYDDIRELFERALLPMAAEAGSDHFQTNRREPETTPRGAAHSPSAMSTTRRSALAQTYNEMHGLIVGVGKHYCKKTHPACQECPLLSFLPAGRLLWQAPVRAPRVAAAESA